MFTKLVPLNSSQHKKMKIRNIQGFGFASKFHVASVMVHEFVRAAAIYPIVFIEDKTQDVFRPVALLGLKAGENLFVDTDNKWAASYVPAIIRRYPFVLAKNKEEEKFAICFDEDSEMINENDGVPLFNEDGSPAEVIENVKRYLTELQQMEAITLDFCQFMAQNNAFAPMNMRVRKADNVQAIGGCYVINEERLNNLSDERFLELRKKRYLPAVYSHLTSLAQIERLMQLAGEALPEKSFDTIDRVAGEESGHVLH
ncbi:SapC family protein [uncultured Desulfobacter sp.]|uniref:SapC family protein n=1 Tax=uncultured Desulfobacter sp. TaxID=240139 RepID=UPI002AA7E9B6|nr:SapC family protein [uncultured Desulfobacter sp.]